MSHSYVQMHNFLNEIQKHQNYGNPEVGDLKWSVRNESYHGWLKCDGSSVPKERYFALYQLITNKFGPETSTHFTLPDASNRILGAIGSQRTQNGVVSPTKNLGQLVGTETHILTENEMPSHNHSAVDSGHTHNYLFPAQQNAMSGSDSVAENDITRATQQQSTSGTANISIGYTGGGLAHNNMQPTLFVGSVFIFSGYVYDSIPA